MNYIKKGYVTFIYRISVAEIKLLKNVTHRKYGPNLDALD